MARRQGLGLWEPDKPLHHICRCQLCAARRLADVVSEAFDRPKAPGIRARMRKALDEFETAAAGAMPHKT